MSGKRKRLYYKLTPVFEPKPGAAMQVLSAAPVTCMATGRVLAGMGGGGPALRPEIVDELDARNGPEGEKLILNVKELETIRRGLRLALIFMMHYGALDEPDGADLECREAVEAAILLANPGKRI